MCYLARRFSDISRFFDDVSELFMDIGDWFYNETDWYWAYRRFLDVSDFFWEIGYTFSKISYEIDDWWDSISDLWYYLDDLYNNVFDYYKGGIYGLANIISRLWDHVYITLTDLVDSAHELAISAAQDAERALSKAVDAYSYAFGWLTDRANEAWARAGEVWGAVTNWCKALAVEAYNKAVWAFEQIALAVTVAAQEIYDWVASIYFSIKDYINGRIADVRSWALGVIEDAKAWVLATIAGPINLINLWFDDIQDFFNDPPGWLWGKVWSYLERYW